jgi:hypothetical protein
MAEFEQCQSVIINASVGIVRGLEPVHAEEKRFLLFQKRFSFSAWAFEDSNPVVAINLNAP